MSGHTALCDSCGCDITDDEHGVSTHYIAEERLCSRCYDEVIADVYGPLEFADED